MTARPTSRPAARPAARPAGSPGRGGGPRRIAFLGDSITNAWHDDAFPGNANHNGFPAVAMALAQHRPGVIRNRSAELDWGYGGYGVDYVLNSSTAVSDIIEDSRPGDIVVIELGTNDIASDTPAEIAANLQTMWRAFQAGGLRPIVCAIPHRDGDDPVSGARVVTNALIASAASADGVSYADWYDALLPNSADNYMDGVHVNSLGASRLAMVLGPVIKQHSPAGIVERRFLNTNPEGAGASGQSAPTGWTAWNKSTQITYSDAAYVAAADGREDWLQIDVTNSSTTAAGVFRAYQIMSAGFSEGDIVAGSWEMECEVLSGTGTRNLYAWIQNSANTARVHAMFESSANYAALSVINTGLPDMDALRIETMPVTVGAGWTGIKAYAGIAVLMESSVRLRLRNCGIFRS